MRLSCPLTVLGLWLVLSLLSCSSGGGNDGVNGPSVETNDNPIVSADAVEVLFLGSGPLIPPGRPAFGCGTPGRWGAFPRGSTITLRVSPTVPPNAQEALRRAAAQIPEATAGMLNVVFEVTPDSMPTPQSGTVTVVTQPQPPDLRCQDPTKSCAFHSFVVPSDEMFDVFDWGFAIVLPGSPTGIYVHEAIGHGILGFCHINALALGQTSIMGDPGFGPANDLLTPLDIA